MHTCKYVCNRLTLYLGFKEWKCNIEDAAKAKQNWI